LLDGEQKNQNQIFREGDKINTAAPTEGTTMAIALRGFYISIISCYGRGVKPRNAHGWNSKKKMSQETEKLIDRISSLPLLPSPLPPRHRLILLIPGLHNERQVNDE
jgi:hypothetical protein